MKPCGTCCRTLPFSDFYPRHGGSTLLFAYSRHCRACTCAAAKARKLENPQSIRSIARRYRLKYRTSLAAKKLAWSRANSAVHRAIRERHRASKRQAIPAWINHALVSEVYRECARKNAARAGGITWNVDHIVPLQSKLVCGLHTHDNLRVIPARLNSGKRNYYWPDMPSAVNG